MMATFDSLRNMISSLLTCSST